MTTIRLYGILAKKYFKEISLEVSSVVEAVKAISVNFPGFEQDIRDGKFHIFIKGIGNIAEKDISLNTGTREIKIAPIISGASNVFRIIVGAILVVVGYIYGNPSLVQLGASLIVGGVIGLLFQPSIPSYSGPNDKVSYNFTGAINTTAQGYSVPLGYGELMVGSAVIHSSIDTIPIIEWVSK